METYLIKTSTGYQHLPEDEPLKIKDGTIVRCEIVRQRNPRHHRKLFALLNLVFRSQEKYSNLEDLLVEFKLKAGWYEEHITMNGDIIYIPKSINFASMEQDRFNEFYSRAIDIALKDFMPDATESEIEAHINEVIGFV